MQCMRLKNCKERFKRRMGWKAKRVQRHLWGEKAVE